MSTHGAGGQMTSVRFCSTSVSLMLTLKEGKSMKH